MSGKGLRLVVVWFIALFVYQAYTQMNEVPPPPANISTHLTGEGDEG